MLPDEQDAALAAAEASAPAHASDSIPVQTNAPEPLQVATETPAAAEPVVNDDVAAAEIEGRKPVEKLPEWAQKRLNEQAFAARVAEREAKRLADELDALRNPPAAPVAQPAGDDVDAANAAAPAGGYKTQADFDAAVLAEANNRQAAARNIESENIFNQACNDVYEKGKGAYADDFDAAVQNLQGVGAMTKEMLEMVLATDDPAKVLLDLGANPDRAAEMLAMPPAKRAIEIAKMAVAIPAKKVAELISKAPAPIRPIEGSARVSADLKDDDDDATWFAKREAQLRSANA